MVIFDFNSDLMDLKDRLGLTISRIQDHLFIVSNNKNDFMRITILLDRYLLSYEYGSDANIIWFSVLTDI